MTHCLKINVSTKPIDPKFDSDPFPSSMSSPPTEPSSSSPPSLPSLPESAFESDPLSSSLSCESKIKFFDPNYSLIHVNGNTYLSYD